LHPLMPFVTEEIWQAVATQAGKSGATIMLQPFPTADSALIDTQAEADIDWLKAVIVGIRNIRGEMNMPPSKSINVLLAKGDNEDKRRASENSQYLKKLTKLDDVDWLPEGEEAPASATALADKLEILVPLAGLIDVEAEVARLQKEIAKLEKDVSRLSAKLANESFVAKAPTEVVEAEREKLRGQQQSLETLAIQQQRLQEM